MEKQPILLRAHHGMCLAFFQGEGYSDLFVAHMGKILEQMQENPSLQIVTCADVICEKCPNLENGAVIRRILFGHMIRKYFRFAVWKKV